MAAPVLTHVRLAIAGTQINRDYPKPLPDIFAGGQLLWVGRYKDAGDVKIELQGKVGADLRTFTYDGQLVPESRDETYAFVEKLWAVRRVGELLNELDLKGRNEELVAELVELSTKHGILTPYTAFLADDGFRLGARPEEARRLTAENLDRELGVVGGAAGVSGSPAADFGRDSPRGGANMLNMLSCMRAHSSMF